MSATCDTVQHNRDIGRKEDTIAKTSLVVQ